MTELLDSADPGALERAAAMVAQGGLVSFPTDTVYGLGCDAFQDQAIQRLYQAKQRPREMAIPILIGIANQVERLARDLPEAFWPMVTELWPGPLTLVVGMSADLPQSLSAKGTIGLRMPDHPLALELLSTAGPMAVTSANRSGGNEARTAAEVLDQLTEEVDLIIDGGRTPGGVASTVLDLTTTPPTILRQGPVARSQLEAFIQF